nr:MauE/DoxX family redox-associated membrane protein [Novosphingobium jiangmenense]
MSAVHKLRDLRHFAGSIAGYDLVPRGLAPAVAPVLAFAELAAGLASLATPLAQVPGRFGTLACATILLGYAGAIGLNIARGNTAIDCGCFGFGARGPGLRRGMVVRNLALAALALPALWPTPARDLVWLDGLTLIGGLAVLALIHTAGETALNLPTRELTA